MNGTLILQSSSPAGMKLRRLFAGRARLCSAVFLAAFTVRIAAIFVTRSYLYPENDELVRIARSLATAGSFADAYADGMGPTAHAAPAWPLLLSAVFRLFGTGTGGRMAQEVLCCALASLQYALLPLMAEACSLPLFAGFISGLIAAFLPINHWVQTKGTFEYSLAGLFLAFFSLITLRIWRRRAFSVRTGAGTGLLAGINLLTSPQGAPFF